MIVFDFYDKISKKGRFAVQKGGTHAIKKIHWEVVIYGVVGLALTILNFILFHHFNDFILLWILLCMVDMIYSYRNLQVFLRSFKPRIEQPIMILFFLLLYWLVLFCVICVGSKIAGEAFSYICYLYPIFLMPAFEIVIAVLMGILVAIGYM